MSRAASRLADLEHEPEEGLAAKFEEFGDGRVEVCVEPIHCLGLERRLPDQLAVEVASRRRLRSCCRSRGAAGPRA